MPSVWGTYWSIIKPRSVQTNNSSNQPIKVGRWGIVFFIIYLLCAIAAILLGFMTHNSLFCICLPVFIILPASILTVITWILWHIILHFYVFSSGLQIANEVGKFELTDDEGWKLSKHLLSHKTNLDLISSSPHIMIVGGSQTGKSTTIKTILLKIIKEKSRGNVILDYHGEYSFLSNDGFVIVDAQDYDPLAQNYDGELFENIVSDFVDSFLVAFETVGDVQLAILKKKLEEQGSIQAALSSIGEDTKKARSYTEKDRLSGLSLRLEKIARYADGTKPLHKLTKENQNIIFDFSGIRDRDAGLRNHQHSECNILPLTGASQNYQTH
ncbi:ATP-binding protein [Candidatus Micrarchaeota archaeon]|nr:ATP-binding protein [Candidatus Micrarchaeota archaeon]MBU1165347.1 ATP-binding protein [Candidatus Micrarchaeota archaeon]MBU1886257.1 ATP-binding protein [Candidatus Micrarchaeota archaeon]